MEDKLPSPGTLAGGGRKEWLLLLDIAAALEAVGAVGAVGVGAVGAVGVCGAVAVGAVGGFGASTGGKRTGEVGWELSEPAVPEGRSLEKLS